MTYNSARLAFSLLLFSISVHAYSDTRWVKINDTTEWSLPATEIGNYKLLLQRNHTTNTRSDMEGKAKFQITGVKIHCNSLRSKLIFEKIYSDREATELIDEQIYDDMWDRIKPRGFFHQQLIARGVCLN